MKILIVTNQFPSQRLPYKGNFVLQQAEELRRQGNEICIVTPNYGKEDPISQVSGLEVFRFRTYTRKTRDPLLRKLFKGLNGYIALFLFLIFQIIETMRVSLKFQVDVIHGHWILPSGFSSVVAAKLLRKKLVITSHGSDLTFCSKNVILRAMLKIVLINTNFFIGASMLLTNIAVSLGAHSERSQTIHLGIPNSLKAFKTEGNRVFDDDRKYKIVFVGSLYQVKGITYLLEAIKLLSFMRNNFEFIIIGDGELMGEMKSYISLNKLEKHCKLLGFLPHRSTLKFIQQSDIAIQTSLSEGLSVFIQESIFLGKPVIATNVGGTKEIVLNNFNGFLIEPCDSEKLVDKLNYLLSNPEQIKSMGRNSIKIAREKLSLEENVKKINILYQKIHTDSLLKVI